MQKVAQIERLDLRPALQGNGFFTKLVNQLLCIADTEYVLVWSLVLKLDTAKMSFLENSSVVIYGMCFHGSGNDPQLILTFEHLGPAMRLPIWLVCHQELRTNPRIRRVFDYIATELSQSL